MSISTRPRPGQRCVRLNLSPWSCTFGKLSCSAKLLTRCAILSGGAFMAFRLIPLVGFVIGITTIAGSLLAQQVRPTPKPKPQTPVEAAQQAAKTAAGFEFLGTL